MKITEYIECPKCLGMGEYHDEINYPLGQEKLVQCHICKGRQEIPEEN